MSELKSFSSERIYWSVEQVEREAGDIDDLHLDDNLFYLKSEVDKVIAELKESIKGLILDNYLKDKELRRQKYKRCFAMTRWCASRSLAWMADPADEALHESDFYDRWKLRWLELAKKFKPNNGVMI